MKSFTQDGIIFNKYREAADGQAIGIAPILVDGQEGVDPEFGGIVNAVDIDWNGAALFNKYQFNPYTKNTFVNTTGELLGTINYINNKIPGEGGNYDFEKNTSYYYAWTGQTLNHAMTRSFNTHIDNWINTRQGWLSKDIEQNNNHTYKLFSEYTLYNVRKYHKPNNNAPIEEGSATNNVITYLNTDEYGHIVDASSLTLDELKTMLGINYTNGKKDVSYSIISPTNTNINISNGSTTSITIKTDVAGKLVITPSIGKYWKATSSSETTASTTHNITITNQNTTDEIQFVNIITADFTPTNTSEYNILRGLNAIANKTVTLNVASAIGVTGVSLNTPGTISLNANESIQLIATISPENATNKNINWYSSDSSIARVEQTSSTGNTVNVIWVSEGQATITAESAANTSKKATVDVNCLPGTVTAESIGINPTSTEILANGTKQITATIYPSNVTDTNIEWSVNDESVVQIQNVELSTTEPNKQTATLLWKKAGTAIVTATVGANNTLKATCNVTCNTATINVTGISVNKTSMTLEADETGTITGTITPSNATNKYVKWSSNNTAVATVSAAETLSGSPVTVTWKGAGNAIVTATAKGNTSYKKTVSITCNPEQATSNQYYYFAGKYPADQQPFCINWSSFDEDAFLAWDGKQPANSINEIKEILSANGGVISMNSNKECIYIVAPTEIIDQISGIRMPVGYLMIERFNGTDYSMILGDEVYTAQMTIEFNS